MVVIVDGKLETKLVDGLDERVKCLICKSISDEPRQTSCRQRICRNCLELFFWYVLTLFLKVSAAAEN